MRAIQLLAEALHCDEADVQDEFNKLYEWVTSKDCSINTIGR